MEYQLYYLEFYGKASLNPYYNGRYSWRTIDRTIIEKHHLSLNPYYNGRYSWSF